MRLILFGFLICSLIIVNVGSILADSSAWLLNIPSCPVKVSLSERKNRLDVYNGGNFEISEIYLGIVIVKNGRYEMISTAKPVEINEKLPVGETQFSGINKYLKDIDLAVEKKAKLAVIVVQYTDGSSWHANSDYK